MPPMRSWWRGCRAAKARAWPTCCCARARRHSIAHDFHGKLAYSWPRTAVQTPLNVGQPDYHPQFPYGYRPDLCRPRRHRAVARGGGHGAGAARAPASTSPTASRRSGFALRLTGADGAADRRHRHTGGDRRRQPAASARSTTRRRKMRAACAGPARATAGVALIARRAAGPGPRNQRRRVAGDHVAHRCGIAQGQPRSASVAAAAAAARCRSASSSPRCRAASGCAWAFR